MSNTNECLYCGGIFEAEKISGPDNGGKPPCLTCLLEGKDIKQTKPGE